MQPKKMGVGLEKQEGTHPQKKGLLKFLKFILALIGNF